jgi:MATE family multidrug resistance protein
VNLLSLLSCLRPTRSEAERRRRQWSCQRANGPGTLGLTPSGMATQGRFRSLRHEIPPMLALAWPVVLAEIGWVAMGIVDTIIVSRLGPAAIGAVGVGSILFMTLAIFGMGVLLGLDTLVSQAYGAQRLDECHRWLLHGVYLAILIAPPMMAAGSLGLLYLHLWGFAPEVLCLTVPYLSVLLWSLLPLLLYAAFRRYLQAMGLVKPVTFALITANVINATVNWLLVFGHCGLPAMGTRGSAWATLLSRIYLAAALAAAIVYYEVSHRLHVRHVSWKLDWRRLGQLTRLGLPAASQVTLEMGVFSMASALAGKLDAVSLASHQIVLNLASLTFMVPLGTASAGAVRVGHAVGRRDPHGAARAGWTALLLGVAFMSSASLAFLLAPAPLLHLFTSDRRVVTIGTSLLMVAAMFQPFDGLQGVATGVLRGVGDTRTPMIANLAAHWCFGLPLGYALCFWSGWGVIGLWIGLATSLILVGLTLLRVWMHRVAALG